MTDRYVPTWRRRRPKRPRWIAYPLVGLLSIVAVVLACLPTLGTEGLAVPISFQLEDGEESAWLMLAIIMSVMAILAWRMAKWGRWMSALALTIDIGGLAYISTSDPRSLNHLFAFIVSAVVTSAWLLLLALELEDDVLKWLAYGAIGGVALSFTVMGYGERVLLLCSLAGANLLYYGYFADSGGEGTL